MAQLLGNVAVGSTVYLKENGVNQPYIVVNQGIPQNSNLYDSSCNGTWLLRLGIYSNNTWNSSNYNAYDAASIQTVLDQIRNSYETGIQSAIKTIKLPYCLGNGNDTVDSGASGLNTTLFLLSGYEVGWSTSDSYLPVDGALLSYFTSGDNTSANNKRLAYFTNYITYWWLRSPATFNNSNVWNVTSDGICTYGRADSSLGVRPAMVMPTTLFVDDSNNILTFAVSTITVPSQAMQGQPLPISWTSVNDATTYQLQRNTGSGWETIYTGPNTSYQDTAGAWATVQYQVAAGIDTNYGAYAQSASIPVVSASALVISGSDSDLGTITSNIAYTVTSDTGNPISLVRTVNGAQVVTLTVDSGFAYSIPIADLPTGTGTIQITASVDTTSSGTVTATRTWTYYKTPINIPSTGGIAQLTQNGQNIWPVTVPDAVEAPVYLGGNLNTALNMLGQAVLYSKTGQAKYNEVTINLANVSVGDEVNLPYNGVMVPHIVVQIGNPDASMYDSSCDGVWLLRKDCVTKGQWGNNNAFASSTIINTIQDDLTIYDVTVQNAVKTVKIPYCIGGGDTTINTLANGLNCKMFLLSGYEVGFDKSIHTSFPVDGAKLSYFEFGSGSSALSKRISNYTGTPTYWWLRSPNISYSTNVWDVQPSGNYHNWSSTSSNGIRPCFILPTTFTATYYVDSKNNVYPSQEYTQSSVITDVFGYDVPIPQIEVGSYVGNGTYGQSNPNTLTFGFEPKVVFIGEYVNEPTITYFWGNNYFYYPSNNYSGNNNVSITGNSMSWYSTGGSSGYQLNNDNVKFYYLALG